MSLEQNKNNVELKELYSNVLEAGDDFDNLSALLEQVTDKVKLKLKSRIEDLKLNSQYESQATVKEKAKIDSWYEAASVS
jgi:hypothetical protein